MVFHSYLCVRIELTSSKALRLRGGAFHFGVFFCVRYLVKCRKLWRDLIKYMIKKNW